LLQRSIVRRVSSRGTEPRHQYETCDGPTRSANATSSCRMSFFFRYLRKTSDQVRVREAIVRSYSLKLNLAQDICTGGDSCIIQNH
jgi:hypothetical protein